MDIIDGGVNVKVGAGNHHNLLICLVFPIPTTPVNLAVISASFQAPPLFRLSFVLDLFPGVFRGGYPPNPYRLAIFIRLLSTRSLFFT